MAEEIGSGVNLAPAGRYEEGVDLSTVEAALERFSTEDRSVFKEAAVTLQSSGVGSPLDIRSADITNMRIPPPSSTLVAEGHDPNAGYDGQTLP